MRRNILEIMFNGIVVEPNIKCRSHVVFNPLDLLLRERRKDCSKVLNIYSILIPYLKFEYLNIILVSLCFYWAVIYCCILFLLCRLCFCL